MPFPVSEEYPASEELRTTQLIEVVLIGKMVKKFFSAKEAVHITAKRKS
jgi:hypothetical protein